MNQKLRLLPKGIQSFSKMIEENYIYVDKTELIYSLIMQGNYYFLSRPRRFGKSLLISTLNELFSGNKKLFKNLWIAGSDYHWQQHPVIQLDFSKIAHNSVESLEKDLVWQLAKIAEYYSINIDSAPSLQTKFGFLVEQLAKLNSVVILIDEYDYAILNNINNRKVAADCRGILRNFFVVIKSLDPYLRFVFLTGVTKFSKTSIFSGLNNLEEITLSTRYETLLGYTKEELDIYFAPYIEGIAQQRNCLPVQVINDMRAWYDGYQFSKRDNAVKIYNPYSVLLFLSNGEFSNYWFESGTPSFLMELIKKQDFPILKLDTIIASEEELGSFEIEDISIKTVLFQAGYFTISYYDRETQNYHLSFPNIEVESSFLKLKQLNSKINPLF